MFNPSPFPSPRASRASGSPKPSARSSLPPGTAIHSISNLTVLLFSLYRFQGSRRALFPRGMMYYTGLPAECQDLNFVKIRCISGYFAEKPNNSICVFILIGRNSSAAASYRGKHEQSI